MGTQLPHKGHSSSLNFGRCLLWPDDWMDQNATWYRGRPQRRRLCYMTRTDRQALLRRVLYCGHSTQYSHLVVIVIAILCSTVIEFRSQRPTLASNSAQKMFGSARNVKDKWLHCTLDRNEVTNYFKRLNVRMFQRTRTRCVTWRPTCLPLRSACLRGIMALIRPAMPSMVVARQLWQTSVACTLLMRQTHGWRSTSAFLWRSPAFFLPTATVRVCENTRDKSSQSDVFRVVWHLFTFHELISDNIVKIMRHRDIVPMGNCMWPIKWRHHLWLWLLLKLVSAIESNSSYENALNACELIWRAVLSRANLSAMRAFTISYYFVHTAQLPQAKRYERTLLKDFRTAHLMKL